MARICGTRSAHMNDDTVFRLILGTTLIGGIGARVHFQRRAEKIGGAIRDRRDSPLFWVAAGIAAPFMLLPLIAYLIDPTWMAWSRMDLPRGVRWLGAVVGVAGFPLLIWVFRSLAENLTRTAATRENARLVTCGPYRWIRHPLYALALLLWFGMALMIGSWAILIGIAVLMPALLLIRLPAEEGALLERFGDDYRAYM